MLGEQVYANAFLQNAHRAITKTMFKAGRAAKERKKHIWSVSYLQTNMVLLHLWWVLICRLYLSVR